MPSGWVTRVRWILMRMMVPCWSVWFEPGVLDNGYLVSGSDDNSIKVFFYVQKA